jgi:hypothetical protein
MLPSTRTRAKAKARAKVDIWAAQIRPALAKDPRRPFSLDHHAAAVANLHDFFVRRAEFVEIWLAEDGHCPAPW